LGGEMRLPRFEIQRQVLAGFLGNVGEGIVALEQVRQSKSTDAEGRAAEQFTPGRKIRISPHKETRWRKEAADTDWSTGVIQDRLYPWRADGGRVGDRESDERRLTRPARWAADRPTARPARAGDRAVSILHRPTKPRAVGAGRSGRPVQGRVGC